MTAGGDGKATAWETAPDTTTYNVDEFYTRASDKRGHSAQLNLRIPPDMMAMVEEIFQSKKFPYRTYGDVMRDALVHRIGYLRARLQSGKVDESYARVLVIQQILEEEELDKDFRDKMQRLDAIVDDRMKDPLAGKHEAAKVVKRVLANVEAIPDGYKRRLYESRIHRDFGYLLEEEKVK